MIGDIQRELDGLPPAVRARTRQRILDLLHRQIAEYDPEYVILGLIAESVYVSNKLPTEKALVELVRITTELDRLDPDWGVREALHWIRTLNAETQPTPEAKG